MINSVRRAGGSRRSNRVNSLAGITRRYRLSDEVGTRNSARRGRWTLGEFWQGEMHEFGGKWGERTE